MSFAVRVPVYRAVIDPDSTLSPVDSTAINPDTTLTPGIDSRTVAAQPLVLDQPPQDRITKFTLAGGAGRYYHEVLVPFGTECSDGLLPVPLETEYIDAGVEIDTQVSRTIHVGVRGGYVRDSAELAVGVDTVIAGVEQSSDTETYYGNPFVAFEWEKFGVGAGVLISSNPLRTAEEEQAPIDEGDRVYPSAHIRIGRLSQFYMSVHAFEGVPIYSAGGLFVAGIGGRPVRSLGLYGGYCLEGPYEEESFMGRVTVDIDESWTLMTTLRFPMEYSSEFGPHEDSEYGVSLGLSYRLHSVKASNE